MTRKAFTLIELLVVIAIIAILAAILFPVFAQAKQAAKKAADISNQKQVSLAIIQYQTDTDDLYPLAWGRNPSNGWPWNYNQYFPHDYPAGAGTDGSYAIRIMSSPNAWANSTQPYAKNIGVWDTPGAPLVSAGGASNALVGKKKGASGLTYNGLLHSYNASGVAQPADIILVWTGRGNGDTDGAVLSNPALICNQVNVGCSYVPGIFSSTGALISCGPGGGANNGETSAEFTLSGSIWVYSKGVNTAFCDGHVKHRMCGAQVGNPPTNGQPYTDAKVDPYTGYDTQGIPGWYWSDGCHAWLFRPDYIP